MSRHEWPRPTRGRAPRADPRIPRIGKTRRHAFDEPCVPLTPETLASSDAVVIVTDHSGVDYALVAAHAKLVVDTRDVMAGVVGAARVLKA